MRQHRVLTEENAFSILTLDDDPIMTSTVQAYFQRSGYRVDVENNPLNAIERIRNGSYDILLLDFLMTPICGDQVVEEIRKFNRDIFIILLTGHRTMAPPIRTIRALDIQGYYEKSDRFDQLELLVESCVKSIRQLRTIRSYQTGLTGMMEALPQIYHLESVEHIADRVLQTAGDLFQRAACFLMVDWDRCELPDGETRPQRALLRTVGEQRFTPDEEWLQASLSALEQADSLVQGNRTVLPMTNGADLVGCLGIELPSPPGYEQLQLMQVFARQASAAMSNALLHTLIRRKNEELDQAYRRLGDSYTEMIAAVRSFVDAKDIHTRNHSDRVSFYSVALARHLGRDEEYCQRLKIAGLFHDIGKMGIPDHILQKQDKLTDEEFEIIKSHPIRGEKMLSCLTNFRDITPWIRGHHERYDGSGYPDGLAGEDIPEQARIISVADSFDAMTSDRRYRKSLGVDRAVEELRRGKGSQFDPQFVEAFVELLAQPGFIEEATRAGE